MRTLIKLVVLVVIGLLAYNYFLGTPEEQRQSREMVGKAKELGNDAWELLRSERAKLQQGKYDGAVDRWESLYSSLQEEAKRLGDSDALRELSKLNLRKDAIDEELNGPQGPTKQTKRELEKLTKDTEALMHEMETKSGTTAPY